MPFVVMAIWAFALLSACGGDDDGVGASATTDATAVETSAPTTEPPAVEGEITVFAAASLTDAFGEIAASFEDANQGTTVRLNFGGSPALRTQLQEGATADIYAPADTNNMDQALAASVVMDAGDTFARNRLAVIVPSDNPAGITALQDLANDGVKLVLAAPDVPVGRYARESIDKMQADGSFGEDFAMRILANVVSEEPNVKAIVTKVQLGEADAGIVYVTDVTPDVAGDVTIVDIPDECNVIATYPIALVTDGPNPTAAQAFVDFVLSEDGQAILAEYGFQPIE